jgi:serine/threonine-protein kinase ATR
MELFLQIMAILQSMLPISELRKDVLGVWDIFVTALRFTDIGPHIGTTAAAFVATWPKMNKEEQARATAILNYLLVDNSQELKSHFQDVVSLDSIPELAKAAKRVSDLRAKWDFKDRVTAILRRCNSENTALAKHSIFEMKEVLLQNQAELSSLARGDSFAPLLGLIYRTLLEVAGRDSDQADDIRLGSFECIGIIGALDPDRFSLPNRERTFMMLTNFREKDEVKDFALHLVESVLVGAFRTANDAKQQIQLAYAIQQLFNFCEFSSKLLHQAGSSSISNKTRIRWQDFTRNKQTLETVAPLLEGRYRVEKIPITHFEYPIYPESSTYREWIRSWTTDLISVVLEHSETESVHDEQRQALAYAQEIFGSFRGVVRTGQDVAVAHYLLPHLVLYVTNIGNDNIRKNIISEINSVLHDQVNPRGDLDSDRRTLSAQVGPGIFWRTFGMY